MAADITKLLARLLLEIDNLTPAEAVGLIRDWYAARRAELHGRPNRLAIVEGDLKSMNQWMEQQLTHPEIQVRQFWEIVGDELRFPRAEQLAGR